MKIRFFLLITVVVLSFVSCEKTPYEEEVEDNTELSGGDASDNSDSDGEEDWEDSDNDSDTPYVDPDVTDGNDNSSNDVKKGDTISVVRFLQRNLPGGVYVKGYIVGCCAQKKTNNDFTDPFQFTSALLMADSPDETDLDKMMAVQLKSGTKIRIELNLEDHPELYKHRLLLFGYYSDYMGGGMKDIGNSFYLEW